MTQRPATDEFAQRRKRARRSLGIARAGAPARANNQAFSST